jgi:hypothetical protein
MVLCANIHYRTTASHCSEQIPMIGQIIKPININKSGRGCIMQHVVERCIPVYSSGILLKEIFYGKGVNGKTVFRNQRIKGHGACAHVVCVSTE